MSEFVKCLYRRSLLFWSIASTVSVVLLGMIDFLTGYEISFSLFYLAPISMASWFAGFRLGLVVSIASAITWLLAEIASGQNYSSPLISAWNTLIRLGFFVTVTVLVDKQRESYQREKELARTDRTTGIANSRHFYELAQMELERARRFGHPFALAFIDLDNFKAVNDRFGHTQGDEVLRTVGDLVKRMSRATDRVARLGGDEFALLLPETDKTGARAAVSKLHAEMLAQMQKHNWPVTFSIGVVIFIAPPESVAVMVQVADELMYSVKAGSKNGVRYDIYAEE